MVLFTLSILMIVAFLSNLPSQAFTMAFIIIIGFVLKAIMTAEKEKGIISADIMALVLSVLFMLGLML